MNVAVFGGGGHAAVIVDIIEKARQLTLLGIFDAQRRAGESALGYEVLGRDEDLPQIVRERNLQGAVVAIGDNWRRAKVVANLRRLAPGIAFPNVIHPSAQLAGTARFGQGSVVMAGAVVNARTTIGDFCILNTSCVVDHDGTLGDYASLAPRACLGGNVEIGEYSAVCLGANVIHRVKIGAQTVVGAGATVLADLPPHIVAYGTPARKVRGRRDGDEYM
jgi:sugar O-acyltransferase (sialic acid O-acetyltransferase NeuD family)